MEENQSNNTHRQTNKSDRSPILIGIVVLLLAVIGFFYFTYEKLKDENEAQAIELGQTVLQLDSISNELDEKILTISQLGGEIDTLLSIKQELEEQKTELLSQQSNQKRRIADLRSKVEGYTELLVAKDAEIEQLRKINEELVEENTELKTETKELNKSIQQINEAKAELAEKVAFASRLKVEGMKVFAVNNSGRERENEFRNRHIDQLKITFEIRENAVAPIEGKELLVKITAPDGNTLFDVAKGSGSFTYEGREQFYTTKQEILYDKSLQNVTVFYKKGSDFKTGKHLVEVYTDSYLMGKGSFIVK